ncbi:UDP-N-acetylmuramate dehydrogenase [Candidatus Sumerlaeota bacterium]|nr:UDP-N-acetylmuramate dehydrogenase [Candidatus Sumerlaeota bacterium]
MRIERSPENSKFMANVPLAPYTTIGVGGQARCLARVSSTTEIISAMQWAEEHKLPVFILGGGSNVVFSDRGYPGMVLLPTLRGVVMKHSGSQLLFSVGAGEVWDAFVLYSVRSKLGGLECLSGIPGTVGAAPVQNIGAYGHDVASVIHTVRVIDRTTMKIEDHDAEWCEFSYRSSRFKREPDRYIITNVTFALHPNQAPQITYTDLQDWFDERPQLGPPTLDTVRQAVLDVRISKGMVYDENNVYSHGCGSFFVNPTLSGDDFKRVIEGAKNLSNPVEEDRIPAHPAGDGVVKVSAAWLIEAAGFKRGTRYESTNIGLNPYHALAIINYGGGAARQIVEFMTEIQDAVKKQFGVDLTPEPSFIGFKENAKEK